MSEERPRLPNRQTPFSEAFKAFICEDWAPYDPHLPTASPASQWATARRQALGGQFPGERLIIPAGGHKVRSNDTDYAFRPHSAFAHLTGLGTDREPDAVLMLEPVAGQHAPTLYFHPRAPRTDEEFYASARFGEMWVGQRQSLDEMAALCGFATADIKTMPEAIRYAADSTPIRILRDVDPALTDKVDALRGAVEDDWDERLTVACSELRLVKDDFEVDQMVQACEATARGFAAVVADIPNAVANGRGERWVEGIFGLHARHQGNAVGYDTIAASGDHANTLHWIRNDGDLREGDLLLMDAGVELDTLYTADVTRTLPVSGSFTPAQRRVYDAVLAAQQAGMDAAKPGAKFAEVHAAAITVLAHTFQEWGILPVSGEDSLSENGGQHRRWMVHGTSHHLGIDVHDCAQALRENYREGTLKEGMVITVEPGIYFKSTDLLVPEELRGIGIRIEDDIVITSDGCRILSNQLPRDADGIEAWMAPLLAAGRDALQRH